MGTNQRADRRSPLGTALVALVAALAAAGCDSDQGQPAQPVAQEAAPAASTQPPAPAAETAAAVAPPVPAVAVTQASWAPDALEELLAPIALYPDALLSQVLAASVNSQEVLDAGNWLLENQDLNGDALDAAAEKAGFGPPMRSLLYFPTVVDMMCQEMDWTRQLGSAFSSDQKAVLDAVQRLRAQAAEVGNLKDTPQQTVETKTENAKTIIEVKPADPMVVYVPQYNPQVVYVQPPPPPPPVTTTTTTVIHDDDDDELAAGMIGFGVGILMASAFHNDYYCHWGYGAVYMGPRPFYPPAYAYRPVYGPAFRPAYGYAPPAGYRNNYRSGYRSGNNVNININNNYFNNFSNNKNLKGGNGANSPLGRDSYAGARNDATTRELSQAAGGASRAGAADNRAGAGGARPSQGNAGANRPASGNLDTNRSQAGNLQGRPSTANRPVDRGYGTSTRPATPRDTSSISRPSPTPAARPSPAPAIPPAPRQTGNAFSGASSSGNGSFDRAASARGNASAGSRPAARSSGGGGGRRR